MSDTPKKRRGRPPAEQKSMALMTWVPETAVDKLCAIARQQRVSVSKAASRILIVQLSRGTGK